MHLSYVVSGRDLPCILLKSITTSGLQILVMLYNENCNNVSYIIQLFGHCIATWYAMSQSLVKLMEIGTSWGVARQ